MFAACAGAIHDQIDPRIDDSAFLNASGEVDHRCLLHLNYVMWAFALKELVMLTNYIKLIGHSYFTELGIPEDMPLIAALHNAGENEPYQ